MIEDLNMIYAELKSANDKSISHLEFDLSKIRAGKASPAMLQSVMVDYYGSPTPLQQVANVNTIDARTITIQPWEKSMLDNIAKGIINSNLGFAPQSNGESLIISVPALTEERRRELAKQAKASGEHAKVGIRNNRKDAMDMIKTLKDDGLSEDMQKDAEAEVQNITNRYSNTVDDILTKKENEIMTI